MYYADDGGGVYDDYDGGGGLYDDDDGCGVYNDDDGGVGQRKISAFEGTAAQSSHQQVGCSAQDHGFLPINSNLMIMLLLLLLLFLLLFVQSE